MTLDDLDKMAYELQPLPEGLQPPETYYFLTMRTLYTLYAFRKLSAEQAKQEKKQVLHQYRDFELLQKIGMQERQILDNIRKSGAYYSKNGCPACKQLANQLCGLAIREEEHQWERCDPIKPTLSTD